MINKNDRKLKECGSPNSELTIEREKVFTLVAKQRPKEGAPTDVIILQSASELGRGLCLAVFNSRDTIHGGMLRFYPVSSAGNEVTIHSSIKCQIYISLSQCLMTP